MYLAPVSELVQLQHMAVLIIGLGIPVVNESSVLVEDVSAVLILLHRQVTPAVCSGKVVIHIITTYTSTDGALKLSKSTNHSVCCFAALLVTESVLLNTHMLCNLLIEGVSLLKTIAEMLYLPSVYHKPAARHRKLMYKLTDTLLLVTHMQAHRNMKPCCRWSRKLIAVWWHCLYLNMSSHHSALPSQAHYEPLW